MIEERLCPRCGLRKPLDQFYRRSPPREKQFQHGCKACRAEIGKAFNEKWGKGPRAAYYREARAKDLKRNPAHVRLKERRMNLSRYGLTIEEFDGMAAKQEGHCALCGLAPKRLVIDHCHRTKRVRGLLCDQCNNRIGWFEKVGVETLLKYLNQETPKNP